MSFACFNGAGKNPENLATLKIVESYSMKSEIKLLDKSSSKVVWPFGRNPRAVIAQSV
jgi:hypothetical protein